MRYHDLFMKPLHPHAILDDWLMFACLLQDLIAIFNDAELELLVCGLPEIDTDDLRANTEYAGYTPSSPVVQYFWEVRAPATPSADLTHPHHTHIFSKQPMLNMQGGGFLEMDCETC